MSTSRLEWIKSSYSTAQGDNCIEVAISEQAVHVRDSKDVERPHFAVSRDDWECFLRFAARS
jgi:hypothetical protein